VDPNIRAAYYSTSQITLERSLPRNLFVTVSWDYNRGIKPPRVRDINAPMPWTGIKPFPNEGQIIQFQGSGLSSHHHLNLTMRQRFSIFNVTGNYRYYHGRNDNSSGGQNMLPSNSYDLNADWGPAGQPVHTFNTSINSRMPLDVYLTTVINARSGNFYSIITGKDDNKDGVINDRPIGVPKNSEVGPHYFNVSFNFSKAFQLSRVASTPGRGSDAGSSPQVNIFANLNNAFNMTHLGTPSGNMTSSFFKKSFSATAPREIEVGVRFQF
jgi:hypothetical protein